MLKKIIENGPFGYRLFFDALGVYDEINTNGFTFEDVRTIKHEIHAERLAFAQKMESGQTAEPKKKTPLSVNKQKIAPKKKKEDTVGTGIHEHSKKLKCGCGGDLIFEGICPGCKTGKAGKKMAVTCISCGFTEDI